VTSRVGTATPTERCRRGFGRAWVPRLAASVILAGLLTACATPRVRESLPGSVQTGYASWYGKWHSGRRTTSGEIYDMNELTAAHPTFPMGTRLTVTNLKNGRSVTVRVNDRGPAVEGRILDLSYAAARELDALADGVVPVRIRVISVPSR
jgi:rare lipoprotein A